MKRPQVWMYGGGRQSACIAALIIQGKLPRPDWACIADTGREKESTWKYLREVIQPALPFKIHIIPKSEFATVDLWDGADGKSLLIPAYTTESGVIGKMSNFCSNKWKTRVCERWLKTQHGVYNFVSWIGFGLDEQRRWAKLGLSRGEDVFFPLVMGHPTRTYQAIRIVEAMGWPTPVHSSCWMCPNMGDAEWIALTPEEFEKACLMDEEIRLTDPCAFLHRTCVPLRQVKFTSTKESSQCELGMCFV